MPARSILSSRTSCRLLCTNNQQSIIIILCVLCVFSS
nr:MAG TPA: hypothetical protein [Caudoviricetes sp.]